jgi:hypothetical protein
LSFGTSIDVETSGPVDFVAIGTSVRAALDSDACR